MSTVELFGLLRMLAHEHLRAGRTTVADVYLVAAYWLIAGEVEESAVLDQDRLF
jgi:hypothetical protein